jgi:hypothetical protein
MRNGEGVVYEGRGRRGKQRDDVTYSITYSMYGYNSSLLQRSHVQSYFCMDIINEKAF